MISGGRRAFSTSTAACEGLRHAWACEKTADFRPFSTSGRETALYLGRSGSHIPAMAILKIARMGNPALRSPAQTVEDAAHPAIRALVSDMVETMLDAGGVGLAAPQVHVPLRIVIFHLPAKRVAEEEGRDAEAGDAEDEDAEALHIFINPVITPIGEEQTLGWEGCLSVPGMRGVVPRFNRVRYEAVGLDGNPIEGEAEGFHARVIQHECDHLDGMLYPMRVRDLTLFGFNAEWDRHPIGLPGAGDDEDTPPQEGAAAT